MAYVTQQAFEDTMKDVREAMNKLAHQAVLEATLAEIREAVNKIDNRMNHMEQKMTNTETKFETVDQGWKNILEEFRAVNSSVVSGNATR